MIARLCCLVLLLLAVPAHAEEDLFERGKKHWAFQPLRRSALPTVRDTRWSSTPIDAFILARLEAEGLRPNSPAERAILLRRVTFDLTGLPPTLEELERFFADSSPLAYRRLVDRLLASPAYGERWGRHWLDVVRYADTNGYERDGDKPNAWRYRDWVIKAFNKNLPFSRFLTEQIAGDEVPDVDADSMIATTFLRLGTWDDEPANAEVDRFDQLDDVLGVTTAAFMAQTIRCSRCHDHFLEPYSQKDYYRLLSVFSPLKRPQNGRTDLDRPVGTREELATFQKKDGKRRADLAEVNKQLAEIDRVRKSRDKKTPVPPEENTKYLALQVKKKLLEGQASSSLPRAYIWFEEGPNASPTRLFRRGNPALVGAEMKPAVPELLSPKPAKAPTPLAHSSGRRLWLANWLTQRDNPLTARVIVNRLWQGHFGKGLVATSNDFGLQGESPSHPELLYWLAGELIDSGWDLKHLHRLILLSSTYQISSILEDADGVAKLPLFGRRQQRRLEAEAVRDGMLQVSGQLHRQMSGPGVYPTLPKAVLASQSRPGQGWGKSDTVQSSRRSVYVFAKRSLLVPELEQLDLPDSTSSCETRIPSTTAPQALTFLNGTFTHEQAQHLADRLIREAGTDATQQIRLAYRLLYARWPQAKEMVTLQAFLTRHAKQIETDDRAQGKQPTDIPRRTLQALCLVLLNTNEFFYLS